MSDYRLRTDPSFNDIHNWLVRLRKSEKIKLAIMDKRYTGEYYEKRIPQMKRICEERIEGLSHAIDWLPGWLDEWNRGIRHSNKGEIKLK